MEIITKKSTIMTPLKKEITKQEFVQAYELSACNVSIACKKCNISRNTFYQWMKLDLDFAEEIKDQEESLKDFAETMLFKGIKEGKTTELIFFLKTKCQSRGYIEKQQLHMSYEEPDLSGLSTSEILSLLDE